MKTNNTPKIAILANFPIAELESTAPLDLTTYWLTSLKEMLSQQTDFEVHWYIFRRHAKKHNLFRDGQYFHILSPISIRVDAALNYLPAKWMLWRELKKLHPQLLHAWGMERHNAICGSIFKGKKLLSVQGILSTCTKRVTMSPFEIKQAQTEADVLKKYPFITTESPWAADRLRELCPDISPLIIEYAVEKRFFSMAWEPVERPEFLSVISNSPIKNIHTLIAAFSDPRLAGITLRIAGISRTAYPDAPENIEFLGRIKRSQVAERMAKAWGLIHPSLADTGPSVVKEARVIGLPVILSTECGSKQHITDGKSGFIVEPKDIESIIKHVKYLAESRERCIRMGMFGRDECRQKLSHQTMAEAFLGLYKEMCST